jgi:LCP family protein required for cell wall assembly
MTELIRDRALRSLPTAQIRHGRLPRPHWWKTLLTVVGAALSVVLVSGTALAGIVAWRFAENIDQDVLVDAEGNVRAIPAVGDWPGGFNIMVSALDNAEGQFDGADRGTTVLNDANLLVHVAEDQQSAVVISIPRDLIVPIPSCPEEDGEGFYSAMSAQQFNVAYSYGGMNCVVLTAEALTGLTIDYSATISLEGVAAMSTAVGGVDICVTEPIFDRYTGLDLPTAGTHTVEGFQAMQFLRTRYGVGDGSDVSRIGSQQQYMASLIRKLQDEGTLTNPGALYGIAQVATQNMRLSSGLTSLDTMVSMARVLADIPRENIIFVQYPATTNAEGRAIPIASEADVLFSKILNGERFTLADDPTGNGTTIDPNAPQPEPSAEPEPAPTSDAGGETPAPTVSDEPTASPDAPTGPEVLDFGRGQTAAQATCSVAN